MIHTHLTLGFLDLSVKGAGQETRILFLLTLSQYNVCCGIIFFLCICFACLSRFYNNNLDFQICFFFFFLLTRFYKIL